jgi:lipopolysaccharide transport system ATP-binding protein
METVISAQGLSKSYKVYPSQRSRLFHGVLGLGRGPDTEIRALDDVTFTIQRGEAVAIIGRNGSGKSTLLEILTGSLSATAGAAQVSGRVSALLELGSGFNPEYSGRDNVLLNGLLLGLAREEILGRFAEIEAFAEIGGAIDRPVKTYSSGMMMRLAFAVQVLCDPEVLIIDEALSVGDFFFQQKCLAFMRELRARGVTLLFVSHDMNTVRDLCPRVIYLQKGRLVFDGPSFEGIPLYLREAHVRAQVSFEEGSGGDAEASQPMPARAERTQAHALWRADAPAKSPRRLVAVAVYDADLEPRTSFRIGEIIVIEVAYEAPEEASWEVSVSLFDKFDSVRTVTGSLHLGVHERPTGAGTHVFELKMQLNLEAGRYALAVNIGEQTGSNTGVVIDETPKLGPLTVVWDYETQTAPFLGQVGLPAGGRYLL